MSTQGRRLFALAAAGALAGGSPTAFGYEATTVANGGTIAGAVRFEGAVPAPERLIIGKDNEVCGDGKALRHQVKVGSDGALAQVVVFLDKVERGKPWPVSAPVTIDQVRCSFDPFLQVVQRGAAVRIVNSDPVLHNIHSFEVIGRARRTLFNIAQPAKGQADVRTIAPTRGNVVELSCDAHNWMTGWIYVMDHPYYALAGADGRFAIADVPPGAYKLVAWHPVLGARSQDVVVSDRGAVTANLTFTAK
jgi:hypothetical protein